MASTRARLLTAVTAVLVATGLIVQAQVLTAPGASAAGATSARGRTPTMDALPTVQVNGIVWSQITVGNTVYAVGDFSTARPAQAKPGEQEVPRSNILAFDVRTGKLITSFDHSLDDEARVVVASPDGRTIYVGGRFKTVDGQTRGRVAAFSTATGALLPFDPRVEGPVYAIAPTPSAVYLGGALTRAGGQPRSRLAAANPTTGAVLPWAPTANNQVRGLVWSSGANRVVAGGFFTDVNGAANHGLAALDATTGASVLPFAAGQQILAATNSTSAGIWSLKTDGNLVYGTGFKFESSPGSQFEGSFAIDFAGNVVWLNDCFGDSYDAAPVNGVVYVASHAHDCAATGSFGQTSPSKYGLAWNAAASGRTNTRDARGWDYSAFRTSGIVNWNPRFGIGSIMNQSVWSFSGNADYVVAGGEFPTVNGLRQQGLARFAYHDVAARTNPTTSGKFGPTGMGPATAQQVGNRAVTVSAQSAWDPDEQSLAYALVRDGKDVVATTTLPTVGFWQVGSQPVVTLKDRDAPKGTHTYAIRARDLSGNTVTAVADPVKVARRR